MEKLEPIAPKLRSEDLHTLSHLYPSLGSNDFWFRNFYAAYGTRLENGNNYMLEYEVMGNLNNGELCKYLLKSKYNTLFKRLVDKPDPKKYQLGDAAMYGNLEAIEYLLDRGADMHIGNELALQYAVIYDHLEVVKYFVEQGADIHTGNCLALRLAAQHGHFEVIKYLVEQGADIHASNNQALQYAVIYDHLEVVKYFVEQGADIHADNDVALRSAAQHGHFEVIKYLVEKGGVFGNPVMLYEEGF